MNSIQSMMHQQLNQHPFNQSQASCYELKMKDKDIQDTIQQQKKLCQQQNLQEEFLRLNSLNCKLCVGSSNYHYTKDCPKGTTFFMLTSLQKVSQSLKKGLKPEKREAGIGIYCFTQPKPLLKKYLKNRQLYSIPVILKIVAHIQPTRVRQVGSFDSLIQLIESKTLKSENVQCIKYPIYKIGQTIHYQWTIYKADYCVVGYAQINVPKSQGVQKQIIPDTQRMKLNDQIKCVKQSDSKQSESFCTQKQHKESY